MTRSLSLALAACAAYVLFVMAGCAQMLGPQSISYSPEELNRQLEKRFPIDRRLLEVLDVKLSQPKVALVPERNHLATELRVEGSDRLFGSRFAGRLALESGVRFDARDQTLRLADVKVTALSFNDAAAPTRGPLQRLGGALVEQVLEGAVIHTLTAEQLDRAARLGYRPAAAQVTVRGLEVTLVPKP